MKAILYKNGVEIRRADYPRLDMGLIDFRIKIDNGDNGELVPNPDNYEWKLLKEDARPTFNQYLERLERSEVDNDEAHPDYPHLKMVRIVYNVVRKSDAEIEQLLRQQEDNANRNLVDKIKYLALYMGIVNRKVDGGNITAKMQTLLDNVDTKLVKLWQNDTNLDNKLMELANGQDPDITDGWTNE